jgi:hypothetical protein
VAVKRSDPRNALRCETLKDLLEVLPFSTGHRSQRESLPNQAAKGV